MGAIDSIGQDLSKKNNTCNYKNPLFSVTSLLYIAIFLIIATSFFTVANSDIENLSQDVVKNELDIRLLDKKLVDTRESFTRLDERIIGVQKELSEIKHLLRVAIESNVKKDY